MDETTEKSIWNKNSTELTVGDSVKIQLIALGVIGGICAVPILAGSIKKKFQDRRHRKPTLNLVDNEK